jgi:hypothetical protein
MKVGVTNAKIGRTAVFILFTVTLFISTGILLVSGATTTVIPMSTPAPGFRSGEGTMPDGRSLARASSLPLHDRSKETTASMTFTAVADADIFSNYPDFNTGDTTEIWAGYDDYQDTMSGIDRGLIRFDISGLPASATIISATLELGHVTSYGIEGESISITTHRITSDWTEMGVNWNNQPGYTDSHGSQSILHSDWGWFNFDVTTLVSGWYKNQYSNYGIMVRGPEVPNTGFRGFASRETDLKPKLIVTYEIAPECWEGVVNGGFEEQVGWTLPITPYRAVYTTGKVRSDDWSVRTGIIDPTHNVYSYSSAWQTVTIPDNATNLTLRFWLYPKTTEPSYLSLPSNPLGMRQADAASSGDAQLVLILNQYGQEIERLVMMRDNITGDDWLPYSFDLSHYIGNRKTIRIYFDSYNNGWGGVTGMYVDDVSLEICTVEPPTPTPTPTPTDTSTPTPTNTPTNTPTPTATPQVFEVFGPLLYKDYPLGISGRIVDTSGEPLPGVIISTDKGQSTSTDDNGRYYFSNLDPDTYIITPQKAGYLFVPSLRPVTLPPSAVQQDFTAIPPTPTPVPYPAP